MAEYIERESLAANGWYLQRYISGDGYAYVQSMNIMDIPAADVVPVVRCADCKYNKTPDKLYAQCIFNYQFGPQDFFCKAGERKDGDGNG